jgi:putative peptide zinc metalloprotease protein
VLAERRGPPDPRPALRKDLGVRRQVRMGEVVWIVKDPEARAYYQFRDAQWELIKLFDGTQTREGIRDQYNRAATGKDQIRLERVLEYEEWLRGMELIEESASERSLKLLDKFRTLRERAAEEKSEGFNVFFIKFHVLDPNRFLDRTVKFVRWLWTPPVVVATSLAAVWTIAVFVQNWEPIWAGTIDLYHFWGKPFLDVLHFFFILCLIGGIHEFAHAYATKIYGGEVHDIGMALFYFTPAFYCNTSDSFMFESRFQRLWVTIAGIYIEVIICAAATALWIASYPDSFLHQFAYKTMLLTGISTIFFNINPLIKVDGYYALSSLLQIQDLRESSFRFLSAWFQKYVLRLPVDIPIMTRRRRRISVAYGLMSMVYTASIMYLVGVLFSNLYNRYFPDIAVVLLLLTLYYIFRKRVRKAARVGKLFYLDKKELLMSPRSRVPMAAALVVVLLLLFIPWSRRTISAETTLKPARLVHLEAPEDAVVTRVLVREGDPVTRGQPIFELESTALDEVGARLGAERDRLVAETGRGRQGGDAPLVFRSERKITAVDAAIRDAGVRRRGLVVRSPIEGRVLTHRVQDLLGKQVTTGTELALLGDCRRLVAEVGVPERLLEYLAVNAPVSALVRTVGLGARRGSIVRISPATLEQPATVRTGQEPLPPTTQPDRFVALARFDNTDGNLYPGAEVKIKIRSRHEAYGVRAWNVFWRWLRSVLW